MFISSDGIGYLLISLLYSSGGCSIHRVIILLAGVGGSCCTSGFWGSIVLMSAECVVNPYCVSLRIDID